MNDDKWLNRAREELTQQSESFDAATLSKLTQARHAALDAVERPRRTRWLLAPALASALAIVAVVGLWNPRTELPTTPIPSTADVVSDIDVLVAEEELELLADLEFYLWLETELPETDAG